MDELALVTKNMEGTLGKMEVGHSLVSQTTIEANCLLTFYISAC